MATGSERSVASVKEESFAASFSQASNKGWPKKRKDMKSAWFLVESWEHQVSTNEIYY